MCDPATESRARLAGVDQVVNAKGLRAREWASSRSEGVFEFGPLRVGIFGGGDLASKRHSDAAFDRECPGF